MNQTALQTILVVDDDRGIRTLMTQFLQEGGYQVLSAANASEARAVLAVHTVDLLVVDIMMPGEDGLNLTQSLREKNQVPILLLTARDALDDRIGGLEKGADDYMTKPFEPRELLARIRALLRRTKAEWSHLNPYLKLGRYQFDIQRGELRQGEEPIFLTSSEIILLRTLGQKPHQPFSREELAQRIGHRVSERSVDVQITRLRRKIDDDPRQPRYIQTVRHIGYALCPDA